MRRPTAWVYTGDRHNDCICNVTRLIVNRLYVCMCVCNFVYVRTCVCARMNRLGSAAGRFRRGRDGHNWSSGPVGGFRDTSALIEVNGRRSVGTHEVRRQCARYNVTLGAKYVNTMNDEKSVGRGRHRRRKIARRFNRTANFPRPSSQPPCRRQLVIESDPIL